MTSQTHFNAKAIRSAVLKKYFNRNNMPLRVVCLTCGNAANELRKVGFEVFEVGDVGRLMPRDWFSQADIARWFPNHFDATSGHLPIDIMNKIAAAFKLELGTAPPTTPIPTGSGETVVCLKMAYPHHDFVAEYDNSKPETMFNKNAALNDMVRACVTGIAYIS